jgi:hypothetical protein
MAAERRDNSAIEPPPTLEEWTKAVDKLELEREGDLGQLKLQGTEILISAVDEIFPKDREIASRSVHYMDLKREDSGFEEELKGFYRVSFGKDYDEHQKAIEMDFIDHGDGGPSLYIRKDLDDQDVDIRISYSGTTVFRNGVPITSEPAIARLSELKLLKLANWYAQEIKSLPQENK